MNKHRVNAFTILEMTIAMLISAIVIGIAYAAFSIVYKSYNLYQTKHNEMATILRLNELLTKDFSRAETIVRDTDGLALKGYKNPVTYRFNDSSVLRISTIIDTFKVKTDNFNARFEQLPVPDLTGLQEQDRIDEIRFDVYLRGEKIPYLYKKQYSSANLIQRLPDAIH